MRSETEGPLAAGTRRTLRLIAAGRAQRVLIAADADERLQRTLTEAATAAGVTVDMCESMERLGRMCRIGVPCAAAAQEKAN